MRISGIAQAAQQSEAVEFVSMGFDIAAWSEAAPGTGLQGIAAALKDQRYEFSGDQIRVKAEAKYLAGLLYAAETTPDNARLKQVTRNQYLQFLQSCDLNDEDPLPGFSCFMGRSGQPPPILLQPNAFLTAYQENATDEDTFIGIILTPGRFPEPAAPTHLIKGEADQALTANTWTEATITWDQDLPEGDYTIVSMKVGSYHTTLATGAARLILDKTSWRPGVFIAASEADKVRRMSAYPAPYENWGKQSDLIFNSKTMPRVELCSPIALTDHIVELGVIADDPMNVGNFGFAR